MKGAQHRDRGDGGAGQLGSDVLGDGRETQQVDVQHLAGAPRGVPMTHAFYCGLPPTRDEIANALLADDIASRQIGDISTPQGRDAIADLMAYMIAQNGVVALYQGSAETGPRALGHRSIFANPCDARARELN